MSENNTMENMQRIWPAALSLLLSIIFIWLTVYGCTKIKGEDHTLHPEDVKADVITVLLSLSSEDDEEQTIAMYEKLAVGFEKQYPGCGVSIKIYSDDIFDSVMVSPGDITPAVYMNINSVPSWAASLEDLTNSLTDVYLPEMRNFDKAVPLGCSVPAVFVNTYYTCYTGGSLSYDELPEGTVFDSHADTFLNHQGKAYESVFGDFLENGSVPVLADSACLASCERSTQTAANVRMQPVTVEGCVPLQYERYCSINGRADKNAQLMGMLWLQYLLTDEAQETMFIEHYGYLPLHQEAFEHAVQLHSGLHVLGGLKLDTAMLQGEV